MSAQRYDVFISYARDDEAAWVDEYLYRPLLGCTTKTGRQPKIYFDVALRGGPVTGSNWHDTMGQGIETSRHFVPVISPAYFDKNVCKEEMSIAHSMRLGGRSEFIKAVVLPNTTVPIRYRHLHYTEVKEGDGGVWFDHLCSALGLSRPTNMTQLELLDTPQDTEVNLTLPALRVLVKASDETLQKMEGALTINARNAKLCGPRNAPVEDGVAEFHGLSLGTPHESVRLVVSGPGMDPIESESFRVDDSRNAAATKDETMTLEARGRPFLFGSGKAVVVVSDTHLRGFAVGGEPLSSESGLELVAPPRLECCHGSIFALADWQGNLHLLREDGFAQTLQLARRKHALTVPGGLHIHGEGIYLGMWSGEVFRIVPGEEPTLLFQHPRGVQAIAAADDQIYVADLDGKLSTYSGGDLVSSVLLENRLHAIKVWSESLTVVGALQFYQVTRDGDDFQAEDKLPVERIVDAFVDTDLPIILDADGRGLRIDEQLNWRDDFHTVPGAMSVASDTAGRYCVLANPDRSYTLLARSQSVGNRSDIVFRNAHGAMTINSGGDLVALSQAGRLGFSNPLAMTAEASGG